MTAIRPGSGSTSPTIGTTSGITSIIPNVGKVNLVGAQDEVIYMLDGTFDLMLDGQKAQAVTGDLIHMPMGIPHGIFNNSGKDVKALFWVSPARSLRQLFEKIHNVADPAEVVRLSAEYDVEFLPPP